MPEQHAHYSASHSHIWLNCSGALEAEAEFPNETSSFAEEGTTAHELAEIKLKLHFKQIKKTEYNKRLKAIKETEYYGEEMESYIDDYVAFVIAKYATLEDAEIHFEQRLDYSPWAKDGFGTGDVVMLSNGKFVIIDLKYGKGQKISADRNPQLMLYGLGLINVFEMIFEYGDIEMIINQPRLDHVSEYSMPVDDLLKWGDEVVKPAVEKMESGDTELCTGDWCDKYFCKARFICRARANEALEVAKKNFKDPSLLDDEEVAEMLGKIDRIKTWCNNLEEWVTQQMLDGKHYDGYKLVEGLSKRKITDPDGLVKALVAQGFDEAVLYERSLLSMTNLEKVVGKKVFAEASQGFIDKPKGKPKIAPADSDKPDYNAAANAAEAFTE
jgi:hypothetical protein